MEDLAPTEWQVRERLTERLTKTLEHLPPDLNGVFREVSESGTGRSALACCERLSALLSTTRLKDGVHLRDLERTRLQSLETAYRSSLCEDLRDELANALRTPAEQAYKTGADTESLRLIHFNTTPGIKALKLEGEKFFSANIDVQGVERRYPRAGTSLACLSASLFLDGLFRFSEVPELRDSVRFSISDASKQLREDYYTEMESAQPDALRQVVAKLLWEVHAPGSDLFRHPTHVIPNVWPRVEEVDRIEPIDPGADPKDVSAEANIVLSILEVLQRTRGLRRAYRSGTDLSEYATTGEGTNGESLADGSLAELETYLHEILRRRYPALLGALDREQPNSVHSMALGLNVLLLYRNVILLPSISKFKEIESVLASDFVAKQDRHGRYYPKSGRWSRYHAECTNLENRLRNYARAFSSSRRPHDLRPFLVLVVGPPGSGKSHFIDSVVKVGLFPDVGDRERKPITSNLAQAVSSNDHLDATWRMLHQSNKAGIRLVVFEEFDSRVEGKLEQFRRVLDPLWDGNTQAINDGGFNDPISTLNLGPYVAVCIMSKAHNLSSARKFLLTAEKGADFLSRIDSVIEIPSFDCLLSQLGLVTCAIGRRHARDGTSEVLVGEAVIWYLVWLDARDNFRSITKALKTVGDRKPSIEYCELNMDSLSRNRFEEALAEYWHVSLNKLRTALVAGNLEMSVSVEVTKGVTDDREKGVVTSLCRRQGSLAATLGLDERHV